MGRGYLAGTAWGLLVGTLVVALASQVTERREVAVVSGPVDVSPLPPVEAPPVVAEAPAAAPAAAEAEDTALVDQPLAEAPEAEDIASEDTGSENTASEDVASEAPASEATDTAAAPAEGPAEAAPPVAAVPETETEVGVAEAAPAEAPAGDDPVEDTPTPVAEAAPDPGLAIVPPSVVAPSDVPPSAPAVSTARSAPEVAQTPAARPVAPSIAADATPQVADPAPPPPPAPTPPAAPPGALALPLAPEASGAGAIARAPSDPARTLTTPRPLAQGEAAAPRAPEVAAAPPPSPPPVPAEAPPAETPVAEAPLPAGTAADPATEEAAPPAPGFRSAEGVRVNRLPRIGGDAGMDDAPAGSGSAPEPQPEIAEAPAVAPPSPGFQGAAGVRVNRLPTIGGGSAAVAPEAPSAEPAATDAALARYAVPFENPGEVPLLSVILLLAPDAEPGPETGLDLPVPVSFAVDAGSAGARAAASAYRAAGREVLLVLTLPEGAAATDVEVALSVNLEAVPEAVAFMDAAEGGFPAERAALAQVVAAAADTGHGLVALPRGINSAQQLAGRAGVPVGTVFRVLEPGSTEAVLRSLDQAAFRARQEGTVILVGEAEPATVTALRRWIAANPNRQVAFAPISAALTAE